MLAVAVVVIDTSVFVADGLSERRIGSSTGVLRHATSSDLRVVLCPEIKTEIVRVLTRRAGWTPADVHARFQDVFDRAIWLKPVPEEPHHLAAVQGHSADTIVVRTAEAIYVSNRPDLVAIPAKYVVSMNTKHFPPGATYAGFMFVTPHDLLAL
jgi:predicted nucleic acid-binding protein